MQKPLIGITCSTLVLADMRGVPRYALVHHYVDCVLEAGGLPIVVPSVAPGHADRYLARLDGLLLSGGLDVDPQHYDEEPHPRLGQVDARRDRFELALARAAYEAQLPILAICRGAQLLNVALGGSLLQDIGTQVAKPLRHDQETIQDDAPSHGVAIEPGTRLAEIAAAQRIRVNSFHHQACDRVAPGFVVSARSADGVVEAIEHADPAFCLGVQWHPERMPTDAVTRALFAAFHAAAEARTDAARA